MNIRLSFSNTRRIDITECEWKDLQIAIRGEKYQYGCFDGATCVKSEPTPEPQAESEPRWVIVADGEGAEARIIEGVDRHEAVHRFMCVCGKPWWQCETEEITKDIGAIDDLNLWSRDEAGNIFSLTWPHETGKITLYKLAGAASAEPPRGGDQETILRLSQHWLIEMVCDHGGQTDQALCFCGWRSEPCYNVSGAVVAWADHVAQLLAHPSSPSPALECTNHLHAEMEADYELCWEELGMVDYEGEDGLAHYVRVVVAQRDRLAEKQPSPALGVLPSAEEWISVEDRLPDKVHELVLVYRESDTISVGWYHITAKRWYNGHTTDGNYLEQFVTHWRELPKPPALASLSQKEGRCTS